MRPLDELSQQKIDERRKEVADGKRFDSRDLLSLMREFTVDSLADCDIDQQCERT